MKFNVKKEDNDIIYKYENKSDNAIEILSEEFGEPFKKYREDFDKTQNYLKTKFLPEFPLTLSLELVNRCNLNCVMCYKKHHTFSRAELDLKIIKKILDEAKANKMPSIVLGLGSEFLLYKNVLEVLNMVRSADIMDVFFRTNGTLLNDEIIESIFKNKISRVVISIDAATAETYNKVRRVDLFDRLEENVNKLVDYKKKYNSRLPVIRLCFVVMDINKHEIDMFIEKWKNKVNYIDFQRCMDLSPIDNLAEVNVDTIKDCFCSFPFYSLSIWSDGRVSPCCTYYGSEKLKFGNVYKQSIKEIWDGPKMNKIRSEIDSKNFNLICRNCLFFRDREWIDESFKKNAVK